jgi:hypothetical protein
MTPQEPQGEQASADAGVQVAIRMLEHSLVAHGATSKKGKALTKAITSLAAEFGKDEDAAQAIMPAELKTALMAPPGGGGGAPEGAPGGGEEPAAAA